MPTRCIVHRWRRRHSLIEYERRDGTAAARPVGLSLAVSSVHQSIARTVKTATDGTMTKMRFTSRMLCLAGAVELRSKTNKLDAAHCMLRAAASHQGRNPAANSEVVVSDFPSRHFTSCITDPASPMPKPSMACFVCLLCTSMPRHRCTHQKHRDQRPQSGTSWFDSYPVRHPCGVA